MDEQLLVAGGGFGVLRDSSKSLLNIVLSVSKASAKTVIAMDIVVKPFKLQLVKSELVLKRF